MGYLRQDGETNWARISVCFNCATGGIAQYFKCPRWSGGRSVPRLERERLARIQTVPGGSRSAASGWDLRCNLRLHWDFA